MNPFIVLIPIGMHTNNQTLVHISRTSFFGTIQNHSECKRDKNKKYMDNTPQFKTIEIHCLQSHTLMPVKRILFWTTTKNKEERKKLQINGLALCLWHLLDENYMRVLCISEMCKTVFESGWLLVWHVNHKYIMLFVYSNYKSEQMEKNSISHQSKCVSFFYYTLLVQFAMELLTAHIYNMKRKWITFAIQTFREAFCIHGSYVLIFFKTDAFKWAHIWIQIGILLFQKLLKVSMPPSCTVDNSLHL